MPRCRYRRILICRLVQSPYSQMNCGPIRCLSLISVRAIYRNHTNSSVVIILLALLHTGASMADAIIRSQAMFADTIAAYYVEGDLDACPAGATILHVSLRDILLGKTSLPERDDHKIIFSPFDLGVLDLAVADLVQNTVVKNGGGTLVKSFLP